MGDVFLAEPEDKIIALCNVAKPMDRGALAAAVRWVEQWRVVSWCRSQNEKGIVPGTTALLEQFQARRFEWPHDVRPPPWGSIEKSSTRIRMTRLRQRWRGRFGKAAVREDIDTPTLRNKVW